MELDLSVRIAAFNWLAERTSMVGDVLPRTLLAEGFTYEGERIPLVSPQGIFKPRILQLPLSITSAPKGPYADRFGSDGFLHYKYRGTDRNHSDNVGLRTAMELHVPLVYLHGVIPGEYVPVWPVYIVHDDPGNLSFTVAADDVTNLTAEDFQGSDARRAYITASVKQRLHQRAFRERVLEAYRSQCSFCRLKHRTLLDAAHILPDREPEGEPTVNNGIALCKLHHAAFDSYILGVTPDYIIEVRKDVLDEEDGPILLHGLQEFHHQRLILPASSINWPNQEFLGWKYERFRKVG